MDRTLSPKPAAGKARQAATKTRGALEQAKRDDKTEHQYDRKQRHPQCQMPLDPDANPLAVAIEQYRDHKEPPASRDDRAQHEQPDIVAGKAGGDGHELEGNRRQALADDDPGAPRRVGSP